MIFGSSTVYVIQDYIPRTSPAIHWVKTSDGNFSAEDRGVSEDVFEADIVFNLKESELITLESELGTVGGGNEAAREQLNITLSEGEEIFGADIDISGTLAVSVVDYGEIARNSFQSFSMPLRLRLITPSYTGSASIANLRIADNRYAANSAFDLRKLFAIDGSLSVLDGETDPGIFKAVFRQTQTEMKAIRRYLLTTARTASVSFPSSIGVSEPFGQRMGAGPFTCKVISWRDLGRKNFIDWELEIVFARVI